eukprot:sb/3471377/
MKFLIVLLIVTVVSAFDPVNNHIDFWSEEDYVSTKLQARTGMPTFTHDEFIYAPCGEMTLDAADWICRKLGHTRGALSVMKNSDAPGRTGPSRAMMSTLPHGFINFFTDMKCRRGAAWLDEGCSYTWSGYTCPIGDETVVECDMGRSPCPRGNRYVGYLREQIELQGNTPGYCDDTNGCQRQGYW